MKSKTIICCLMAAVLMSGTAASSICAIAATDDSTVASGKTESSDSYYFEWDRSDDKGLTINFGASFDEAIMIRNNRLFASLFSDFTVEKGQVNIGVSLLAKLDDGENTLELLTKDKKYDITINVTNNHPEEVSEVSETSGEEFVLQADNTAFEWDRNGGSDIAIMTNSFSKQIAVKSGMHYASSLINDSVSINDGQILISADFLKKLDAGENDLYLMLKEGIITVKVVVSDSTPQEPSEEKVITAEETELTWDRSDLIGVSVNTNSDSRNIAITKDGEPFASNKELGVYVTSGRVGITANILKNLDDGENSLVFEFDDGTITVNIYVTNKKHSEDTELSVGETEFEWSRNSEDGIVIQTNSGSESFTVKKDNRLFASSLLSKDLSIEEGQIYLDAGFLKKLDNGENHLTLMLKEGCVDVTVTVIDDGQESTGDVKEITADETYFTWDRSNLIGIAVKTNSSAGNVVVTKDGQPVFSNKDKGVYITLGRVGITANYLKKLDNGENKLVFEFDDGNLSVTINVTDRKNKSGSSSGLTAERSVFTWRRNSSEGISIKTNSVSSTASVRKSGMLSLISKSSSISIQDGTVTLTPEYLSTLSDGKNNLTLVMDDGSIDIIVNVVGDVAEQSYHLQSSSYLPSSSGFSGNYPQTGGVALVAGAALTAVSAGIVGIAAAKKRRKKK